MSRAPPSGVGEPGVPQWVAAALLPAALLHLAAPLSAYAADSAFYEGPNYGAYNARVLVPLLHALESAFGAEYAPLRAILGAPGLLDTPRFTLSSFSPQYSYFDWADTGS